MKKEYATFAMGCFWKPDILFSKIPGVIKTEVGYTGVMKKNILIPLMNKFVIKIQDMQK